MRDSGKRLSEFLWRLTTTTVWVAAGILLLTLIPEELAPWLIYLMMVTVLPIFIVLGAVLFFAIRKPQAFGFTILAILVLSAAQGALMAIQEQQVKSVEIRQFLPPSQEHSLVVADKGASMCDPLCMEVLVKSRYRMFAQQHYYNGDTAAVLELRRGPSCADPDTRKSYVAFLQAGFLDVCAVEVSPPAESDALTIRSFHRGGSRVAEGIVPRTFVGSIYELHEARGGQDQLLGRWVEGYIRPLSYWFGLVGLGRWTVGEPFQPHEFFAAALQAPLVGGEHPGGADLDDVLDRLDALPADPTLARDIQQAYDALAAVAGEDGGDLLARRAGRLLNSTRTDQILHGFELLQPWKVDVQSVVPRIIALLDHQDPQVAVAALGMIYKLPKEDRRKLRAKLVAFAESPALATSGPGALRLLLSRYGDIGAFPKADRERAEALLSADDSLTGSQRVALLGILANGSPENRAEASAALFALKDQPFLDLVLAMKEVPWRDISGAKKDAWTDQEKTELVEHAKRVPADQLKPYVDVLRSQGVAKDRTADLAAVITQRIEETKASVPPDWERIKELERLLRAVQR